MEAFAEKGESFLSKTHAGKHALLISFYDLDSLDSAVVYFWDP